MQTLLNNLSDKLKKYLGSNWNPLSSLERSRLLRTHPELDFSNVPLPQVVLTMAELPLVVDYSNIEKVHVEFTWAAVYGETAEPIKIQATNADVRLRLLYPSEWDPDFWENKFIKKEAKKMKAWETFGSLLSSSVADMSLRQSAATKTINSLNISIKNIRIQIVDDNICQTPFAFEAYIDELKITSPSPTDPRLSDVEKHAFSRHLMQALWIRFLGFHFFFKEFSHSRLPDPKATFTYLKQKQAEAFRLKGDGDTSSHIVGSQGDKGLSETPDEKLLRTLREQLSPLLLKAVDRAAREDSEALPVLPEKMASDVGSDDFDAWLTNPEHRDGLFKELASQISLSSSDEIGSKEEDDSGTDRDAQSIQVLPQILLHTTVEHAATVATASSSESLTRAKDSPSLVLLRRKRNSRSKPPAFAKLIQPVFNDNFGRNLKRSLRSRELRLRSKLKRSIKKIVSELFRDSVSNVEGESLSREIPHLGRLSRAKRKRRAFLRRLKKSALFGRRTYPELEAHFESEEERDSNLEEDAENSSSANPTESDDFVLLAPEDFSDCESVFSATSCFDEATVSRASLVDLPFPDSPNSSNSSPENIFIDSEHNSSSSVSSASSDSSDSSDCSVSSVYPDSTDDSSSNVSSPTASDTASPTETETTSEAETAIETDSTDLASNAETFGASSESLSPGRGSDRRELSREDSIQNQEANERVVSGKDDLLRRLKRKLSQWTVPLQQSLTAELVQYPRFQKRRKYIDKVCLGDDSETSKSGDSDRIESPHPSRRFETRETHGEAMPSVKRHPRKADPRKIQRVFNSYGDPNLLEDNSHVFRVTPAEGMEMHVFFKKWELRALSIYDLSKESAKETTLAFIRSDSQKSALNIPPTFEDMSSFPELNLTASSAAFCAIFSFIRHLEMFSTFVKGSGVRHRQVLTSNDAKKYYALVRSSLSTTDKERLQKTAVELKEFEKRFVTSDLMPVKEMAAKDHLSPLADFGGAVRKNIRDQTSCRPHLRGGIEQSSNQHRSTFSALRCCGGGGNIDLHDFPRRLSTNLNGTESGTQLSQVPDIFGPQEVEHEVHKIARFQWFIEESRMTIAIPKLNFSLVPVARSGTLKQGKQLAAIGRPLPQSLKANYPPSAVPFPTSRQHANLWRFVEPRLGQKIRNRKRCNFQSHLGVVNCLTFSFSMKIVIEKWTVFRKGTYISLSDIWAHQRSVILALANPEEEVCASQALKSPVQFKHTPKTLVMTADLSEYPSLLAISSPGTITHYCQLLKSRIAPNPKIYNIFDTFNVLQEDIVANIISSKPVFKKPEILPESDVPIVKTGAKDGSIFRLYAPYFRPYILRFLDPSNSLLVALEDDQLTSRKRVQILVPQLAVSVNLLLQFLQEFPPHFKIHRDLFADIDAPQSQEQITAVNEGMASSSMYKTTSVYVPSVVIILLPKSRLAHLGIEVDSVISSWNITKGDGTNIFLEAADAARVIGPPTSQVSIGVSGFKLTDDSDRTMVIEADHLTCHSKVSEGKNRLILRIEDVLLTRVMAAQVPHLNPKPGAMMLRPEVMNIEVGAVDVVSLESITALVLSAEDITQTVIASLDFKDFDRRLKQYGNHRNIYYSQNPSIDPHPQFQIEKLIVLRNLPNTTALPQELLKDLSYGNIQSKAITLFLNIALGRLSVNLDVKSSPYFSLNILDCNLLIRKGIEARQTLSISSSVDEVFVAATSQLEDCKPVLKNVLVCKHLAKLSVLKTDESVLQSTVSLVSDSSQHTGTDVAPSTADKGPRVPEIRVSETRPSIPKSLRLPLQKFKKQEAPFDEDKNSSARSRRSSKDQLRTRSNGFFTESASFEQFWDIAALEPLPRELLHVTQVAQPSTVDESHSSGFISWATFDESEGQTWEVPSASVKEEKLHLKEEVGRSGAKVPELWRDVALSLEDEIRTVMESTGAAYLTRVSHRTVTKIRDSNNQISFHLRQLTDDTTETDVLEMITTVRSLFTFSSPQVVSQIKQLVEYYLAFVKYHRKCVSFFLKSVGQVAMNTLYLGAIADSLTSPETFQDPILTLAGSQVQGSNVRSRTETAEIMKKPQVSSRRSKLRIMADLNNLVVSLINLDATAVNPDSSENTPPTPAADGDFSRGKDVACLAALRDCAPLSQLLRPTNERSVIFLGPQSTASEEPSSLLSIQLSMPMEEVVNSSSIGRAALICGESIGVRFNINCRVQMSTRRVGSRRQEMELQADLTRLEVALLRDICSMLCAAVVENSAAALLLEQSVAEPPSDTPVTEAGEAAEDTSPKHVTDTASKCVWSDGVLRNIRRELDRVESKANRRRKSVAEAQPADLRMFTLELMNVCVWSGMPCTVGEPKKQQSTNRQLWESGIMGHNRDVTLLSLRLVPAPPPFASASWNLFNDKCMIVPLLQSACDVRTSASLLDLPKGADLLTPWLHVSCWNSHVASSATEETAAVFGWKAEHNIFIAHAQMGPTLVIFEKNTMNVVNAMVDTVHACLSSASAVSQRPLKASVVAPASPKAKKEGQMRNLIQLFSALTNTTLTVPETLKNMYTKSLQSVGVIANVSVPHFEMIQIPLGFASSRLLINGDKINLLLDRAEATRFKILPLLPPSHVTRKQNLKYYCFGLLECDDRGIVGTQTLGGRVSSPRNKTSRIVRISPSVRLGLEILAAVIPSSEFGGLTDGCMMRLSREPSDDLKGRVGQPIMGRPRRLQELGAIVEAAAAHARVVFEQVWRMGAADTDLVFRLVFPVVSLETGSFNLGTPATGAAFMRSSSTPWLSWMSDEDGVLDLVDAYNAASNLWAMNSLLQKKDSSGSRWSNAIRLVLKQLGIQINLSEHSAEPGTLSITFRLGLKTIHIEDHHQLPIILTKSFPQSSLHKMTSRGVFFEPARSGTSSALVRAEDLRSSLHPVKLERSRKSLRGQGSAGDMDSGRDSVFFVFVKSNTKSANVRVGLSSLRVEVDPMTLEPASATGQLFYVTLREIISHRSRTQVVAAELPLTNMGRATDSAIHWTLGAPGFVSPALRSQGVYCGDMAVPRPPEFDLPFLCSRVFHATFVKPSGDESQTVSTPLPKPVAPPPMAPIQHRYSSGGVRPKFDSVSPPSRPPEHSPMYRMKSNSKITGRKHKSRSRRRKFQSNAPELARLEFHYFLSNFEIWVFNWSLESRKRRIEISRRTRHLSIATLDGIFVSRLLFSEIALEWRAQERHLSLPSRDSSLVRVSSESDEPYLEQPQSPQISIGDSPANDDQEYATDTMHPHEEDVSAEQFLSPPVSRLGGRSELMIDLGAFDSRSGDSDSEDSMFDDDDDEPEDKEAGNGWNCGAKKIPFHTRRKLAIRVPSRSVVRASILEETRPFPWNLTTRAQLSTIEGPSHTPTAFPKQDKIASRSFQAKELLFAVFFNGSSQLTQKDKDEVLGVVAASVFVAMGIPVLRHDEQFNHFGTSEKNASDVEFNEVVRLSPETALLGGPSGRIFSSELFQDHFQGSMGDDIICSLKAVKANIHLLRCFDATSKRGQSKLLKPVPLCFDSVSFPVMCADLYLLKESLLCPVQINIHNFRMRMSTGLFFQLKDTVAILSRRMGKAVKAWGSTAEGPTVSSQSPDLTTLLPPRDASEIQDALLLQVDAASRQTSALETEEASDDLSDEDAKDKDVLYYGITTKPLTKEEAEQDARILDRARDVARALLDANYDLHTPDAASTLEVNEDAERILRENVVAEYQEGIIQGKSTKALGRFFYETLIGRLADSVIYHLAINVDNVECSLTDRGIVAFRLWVPHTVLTGPFPIIGESRLTLETEARFFCWNSFTNKQAEITDPLRVQLDIARQFLLPHRLHLPAVDITMSISPLHILISAGSLISLNRVLRSISNADMALKTGIAQTQDNITLVNCTGAIMGVVIMSAQGNRKLGAVGAKSTVISPRLPAKRDGSQLASEPEVAGIITHGIVSHQEYVIEDPRSEVLFSLLRQDLYDPPAIEMRSPNYVLYDQNRFGMSPRDAAEESSSDDNADDEFASEDEYVDHHEGATGANEVKQNKKDGKIALTEIKVKQGKRALESIEEVEKLWRDLSRFGEPEFLSTARILAEDPELREICALTSETNQASRDTRRAIVEKSRPYRRSLIDNQNDYLMSTTRHVEHMLEGLISDAPFLLRNRIDLLSNIQLTEKLFSSADGWLDCGPLKLESDSSRGYYVKNFGHRIVVEPQTNPSIPGSPVPEKCLYIGTSVQVENVSSIPFLLTCQPRKNRLKNLAAKLLAVPFESLPKPFSQAFMKVRDRALFRRAETINFDLPLWKEHGTIQQPEDREPPPTTPSNKVKLSIVVPPYAKTCIPLNWFQDPKGHQIFISLILPELTAETSASIRVPVESPKRSSDHSKNFRQLHQLLMFLEAYENMTALDQSRSSIEQVLIKRLSKILSNPVIISFSKGLTMTSSVKSIDVATNKATEMTSKYIVKLEPFLFMKNLLPFPITLRLTPKFNVANASRRPSPDDSMKKRNSILFPLAQLTPEKLINYTTEIELQKLKLLRSVSATVPTNWVWGVPFASQELEMEVCVHGMPIDFFEGSMVPAKFAQISTGRHPLAELRQLQQIVRQAVFRDRPALSGSSSVDHLINGCVYSLQTSTHYAPGGTKFILKKMNSSFFTRHERGNSTIDDWNVSSITYSSKFPMSLWLYGAEIMSQRVRTILSTKDAVFPPAIQHACDLLESISSNSRRGSVKPRGAQVLAVKSDPRRYFSSFVIGINSTRRGVSLYAPCLIENLATDSVLVIGNRPLPPKCRLFTTEEDIKNSKIAAFQQHPETKLAHMSQWSSKLDYLSNPNKPRPPIYLSMPTALQPVRPESRWTPLGPDPRRLQPQTLHGAQVPTHGARKFFESSARHNAVPKTKRSKNHSVSHDNASSKLRTKEPSQTTPDAPDSAKGSDLFNSGLPRSIALGMIIRYAESPFSQVRIISFVPYFHFYSRLPFAIHIIPSALPTSMAWKKTNFQHQSLEPAILLRPNELRVLHTAKSHAFMASSTLPFAGRPFPLNIQSVPSVMQLRFEDYNDPSNERSMIIQINVVSGHFRGVKSSSASYSFSGLFFILSIPTSPHFLIRNMTSRTILCAPDSRSDELWERGHVRDLRNLRASTKETRKRWRGQLGARAFTANSGDLINWLQRHNEYRPRMLDSGCGMVHFAIPGEEDRATASIMLQQVKKARWHTYSLVSVRNEVSILEFEAISAVNSPMHSKADSRDAEDLGQFESGTVSLGSDGKSRLYSILTVNKEGSRILHLVESREVVEAIKRGDISGKKNIFKKPLEGVQVPFVRLRFALSMERIRLTWTHSGQYVVALHLTDLSLSGLHRPRKVPQWVCNVGALFDDSQLHGVDEGALASIGGSVEELRRRRWVSKRHPSRSQLNTVRERFASSRRRKTLLSRLDPEGLANDLFMVRMTQVVKFINMDADFVQQLKTTQMRRCAEMMIGLLLNGMLKMQVCLGLIHCDHYVEGDVPVLLKSAPTGNATKFLREDSSLTSLEFKESHGASKTQGRERQAQKEANEKIEQLLELKLETRNQTIGNSAVWVVIHKHLLDPTHASVYDRISIHVSPMLVNVEIDVVEQIASLVEKQRSVVSSSVMGFADSRYALAEDVQQFLTGETDSTAGDDGNTDTHKIANAIMRPPIVHTVRELRKLTESNFKNYTHSIFVPSEASFSPVLVLASPRWGELKDTHAVYFQRFSISPLEIAFSIRTSGKKISRDILYIVDALPLDSPYMAVQVPEKRRIYFVSTWTELIANLRHSYIRCLIQRSLPSAWLYYPLAPIIGAWRGLKTTIDITKQEFKNHRPGALLIQVNAGVRLGVVMIMLNIFGGSFHVISFMCNIIHKVLGGYRPRPSGIIDGFAKGFVGGLLDFCWRPWVSLIVDTKNQNKRGEAGWKVALYTLLRMSRCVLSPVMGILNFVASVTEGFANALIGDFEHLSRIQEPGDLPDARFSRP